MKTTTTLDLVLSSLVLLAVSSFTPAQAAPLAVGTTIGVDFGTTPPTNNFNVVDADGANVILDWSAAGDWVLEAATAMPAGAWTPVSTNGNPVTLPITGAEQYFRLTRQ